MKKITLKRRELYERLLSTHSDDLCAEFEIDVEGIEEICKRLNVPIPEKIYWKRLAEGKKVNSIPLPEKSKGTESVVLYKRDDEKWQGEHIARIKQTLAKVDANHAELKDYSIDRLILSTKEGINKHWEVRHKYSEKSLLLSIHVAPETLCRALLVMDLLIKVIRFKGHQLIVEKNQTFVVIDKEKLQISLGEKNRRVEYTDNYNSQRHDLHPIGVLFIKKDSYPSREWKDGPKKGSLEDQMPTIVNDLIEIAREQKEENERWQKARIEQEERDRIKRKREESQKKELAMFKELLFEAHRFSLSSMVRDYINHIESLASVNNTMTDELKNWISWSRKKADWFDPTLPEQQDDLLRDVDIENLRTRDNSYGGYYSGFSEPKENSFWKPWYLK